MNNDVWSSPTATMNIANRVMRDIARHHRSSFGGVANLINDVGKEYSKRGKLSRVQLEPTFDRLITGLRQTDNIIDIHTSRNSATEARRFSANEGYVARFIQAFSVDEEWMVFLATELHMTRRQIAMTVNSTEFSVSAHLLSRYMQRGRQSYLAFLATVLRPIRVASMLAPHRAATGHRLVVPIAGGLLAGTISSYQPTDEETLPTRFIYDRNGSREEPMPKDEYPDEIISTWMRTFIDRESLNPKKVLLLDEIERWERTHAKGIEAWYQASAFGNAQIPQSDDAESMKRDVSLAAESCKELVDRAVWADL